MARIKFIGASNAAGTGSFPQVTGTGGGTLSFTDDTTLGQRIGGYVAGAGTAYVKAKSDAKGVQALGYAKAAASSTASLYATGNGSRVTGVVEAANGATGQIYAKGHGAFTHAYLYTANPLGNAYPYVGSNAIGAATFGAVVVKGTGTGSNGYHRATGKGALVGGYHYTNGTSYTGPYCEATANGSVAWGATHSGGTDNAATLRATGVGAVALGYAKSTASTYARIRAAGIGSMAGGYAQDRIYANGKGSFAWGYAKAGYRIVAHANVGGGWAFGYADTGNIYAGTGTGSPSNVIQFGPGSNNQDTSLQVGSTIRIKGTTGAPTSSLHNGDIWVANNYVYMRSNGVSVKTT